MQYLEIQTKYIIFKLSQAKELNNDLKSKQFISKKEGQKMEKVLKTTIYHQKRSKHS